ncbi:MAG TPA: PhzF family phenazine biosynthesis protein [Caulobacteraceae bacterium]|jgi:PhzF family phenazine biosynthesis protein
MDVQRFAAFSDGETGGNPAGVVIGDVLPEPELMQAVAAEVGYSETVFAAPAGQGWRVRYFAPEMEVPFCGHATIALGAAMALRSGDGVFALELNDGPITVEGRQAGSLVAAALQSPRTHSAPAPAAIVDEALAMFSLSPADLDGTIPPAIANAGADHLVLALASRARLSAMRYDLETGRRFTTREGLATISLLFAETPRRFHARNPFAAGGVYEDPATGAGAAALAGYLRDLGWPHGGAIDIVQGEDMGMRSLLHAKIPPGPGESIRVSGMARRL